MSFLDRLLKRETVLDPIAGTETSLQAQIQTFYANQSFGSTFSPRLADRVWAANRCLQLNSQQVASMPLRFYGAGSSSPPAWVSSPDPVWFPNGIGDAIFAIVWSMYAHGDAFILITDRYASGFPSAWTVLNAEAMSVTAVNGARAYRYGQTPLRTEDVVQISRDPRGGLRGTSALQAYAANAWNLIIGASASGDILGSAPPAVLKSARKLTADQAAALQTQWATAASNRRRGVPPILPPDIDLVATNLGLSPKDLLLLDSQEYDARVVASAYGVPPFALNLPMEGGLTYQNPEMLIDLWWRSELRPSGLRVSQAFSANMLPRGSWVEFDARETLMPAFKDQVDSWAKLLALAVPPVSNDEFRAAVLGLPPQEEGDALEELQVPPAAATSGTTTPGATVAQLRPVQEVGV